MPPLWQYFSLSAKADERMAAPKGRGSWTPGSSSLQIGVSWGSGMGATTPFVDLSGRHLGLRDDPASAVSVLGEGHPPLWQYLARLLSQSSSSAHPKASAPAPRAISPAKRQLLRVPRWGHGRRSWTPSCRRLRLCGSWERRPCPRCGSTCSGREKGRQAHRCPKERGWCTPTFPPANRPFLGRSKGHHLHGPVPAAAPKVSQGHAPFVAVPRVSANGRVLERDPSVPNPSV
jgi:hypothetical protein